MIARDIDDVFPTRRALADRVSWEVCVHIEDKVSGEVEFQVDTGIEAWTIESAIWQYVSDRSWS